jgi:hypothetical protein
MRLSRITRRRHSKLSSSLEQWGLSRRLCRRSRRCFPAPGGWRAGLQARRWGWRGQGGAPGAQCGRTTLMPSTESARWLWCVRWTRACRLQNPRRSGVIRTVSNTSPAAAILKSPTGRDADRSRHTLVPLGPPSSRELAVRRPESPRLGSLTGSGGPARSCHQLS